MSEFEKRIILGKLTEAFNLIGLKEQEALQLAHDMLNVYLQQRHEEPTDFKDWKFQWQQRIPRDLYKIETFCPATQQTTTIILENPQQLHGKIVSGKPIQCLSFPNCLQHHSPKCYLLSSWLEARGEKYE